MGDVWWFAACSRHMDVAVVLDMSGSNEQIFDAMFDFTRILTLGLPISSGSTRVSVVRYSDSANVSFHLDKYTTSQQVRYGHTTNFSLTAQPSLTVSCHVADGNYDDQNPRIWRICARLFVWNTWQTSCRVPWHDIVQRRNDFDENISLYCLHLCKINYIH